MQGGKDQRRSKLLQVLANAADCLRLTAQTPPFGRVPGFLELAKNFTFLIWKLPSAHKEFMDGHCLIEI